MCRLDVRKFASEPGELGDAMLGKLASSLKWPRNLVVASDNGCRCHPHRSSLARGKRDGLDHEPVILWRICSGTRPG